MSNERRAASIGPGVKDYGNPDSDGRGRTGARRAASMMPSRDTSVGLSYPSRDSAIHEPIFPEVPNQRHSNLASSSRAPLSRITSSTDLEGLNSSIPSVQPWEPSPAYEAVSSAPNSPSVLPTSVHPGPSPTPARQERNSSLDSFDLNTRRSSSPLSHGHQTTPRRRFDGVPTHPSPLGSSFPVDPSPLGPASEPTPQRSESPLNPAVRPQFNHVHSASSTGGSTASHEADTSDADTSNSWGGSGREGGTLHEEEEEDRMTEEDDAEEEHRGRSGRGRPGMRSNGFASTSATTPTIPRPPRDESTLSPPPSANRNIFPQELALDLRRTISSSTSTATTIALGSSSLRGSSLAPISSTNKILNPPPGRSASSRPSGRFSLAGLSDALRGKSTSRVRDPLDRVAGRTRAESPDTRSGGRQESRGRKTALKILREALTSGGDIGEGSGEEDNDEDDAGSVRSGSTGKGTVQPSKGWKEFRAGTYTYPISIPIAASLPPSIISEFGTVTYTLKATVHRAGALTPNLTSSTEVTLVSCPGQDDTEESESIVVERFWETQMKYRIALSGKVSSPCLGFPFFSFRNADFLRAFRQGVPCWRHYSDCHSIGSTCQDQVVSSHHRPRAEDFLLRLRSVLFFSYQIGTCLMTRSLAGRKLTRHENPKKFPLLRIDMPDPKEPLLPIISDDSDAILRHPLAPFFINPTSSDGSFSSESSYSLNGSANNCHVLSIRLHSIFIRSQWSLVP